MSLRDKAVIVTGASSEIGAAIALKFAEEGANVTIVGRNAENLKNVSENIAKVGNKPLVIAADVTIEDDVNRIVNDTLKQFGKLDVLINNVDLCQGIAFSDENAMSVYDSTMNLNMRSIVHLTHISSEHLIKTEGNVINISSVAGQMVLNKMFAYCTSKAALDHFSRGIALDFSVVGVRVNTISLGPVKTNIKVNSEVSKETVDAMWDHHLQNTPLKHLSEPSEIAELALFLAGDKAVGITGSNYVLDSGFLLRN